MRTCGRIVYRAQLHLFSAISFPGNSIFHFLDAAWTSYQLDSQREATRSFGWCININISWCPVSASKVSNTEVINRNSQIWGKRNSLIFTYISKEFSYCHLKSWYFLHRGFFYAFIKYYCSNYYLSWLLANWCPYKFCARGMCFIYPTLVPALTYGVGIYWTVNFASGKFMYYNILVSRHSPG